MTYLLWLDSLMSICLKIDGHINFLTFETVDLEFSVRVRYIKKRWQYDYFNKLNGQEI